MVSEIACALPSDPFFRAHVDFVPLDAPGAVVSIPQNAAGRSFSRLRYASKEKAPIKVENFLLFAFNVYEICMPPRLRPARTCWEIAILIFKHERAID